MKSGKSGKIWGETEVLLQTPVAELHRVRAIPRAFCSEHLHHTRWNAFYVVSGTLVVEVVPVGYTHGEIVDRTVLRAGELTAVPPGVLHRFLTEDEPVEMLELYFPAWLGAPDIERRGSGGKQTA